MTAEAEPKFRRIRRSASQANLESRHQGREGRMLENALRTPPQGREGYSLTHGLHPYPARFHPNLPRTILKWLAQEHRDYPPACVILSWVGERYWLRAFAEDGKSRATTLIRLQLWLPENAVAVVCPSTL